jgi:hypothetical protein
VVLGVQVLLVVRELEQLEGEVLHRMVLRLEHHMELVLVQHMGLVVGVVGHRLVEVGVVGVGVVHMHMVVVVEVRKSTSCLTYLK